MFDFDFTHQQRETIDYFIESGEFASQDEVVCAGLQLLCEDHISRLIEEARNSPIIENWTAESFLAEMKQEIKRTTHTTITTPVVVT